MIIAVADTHTVIWYLSNSTRLSVTVKSFFLSAAANNDQIAISSISFIEIIYLIEKGKIPTESLNDLATAIGQASSIIVEIPLDLRVARSLLNVIGRKVPDMPDRIIVATALYLQVPLITKDAQIIASGIQTIW